MSGAHQENRESAVKTVIEYIADKIYSGELRAGDRIPTEPELCAALGISRTSVREAIKALEAQAVLSAQQGRGTYITPPEGISISTPLNFKIKLAGITWSEVLEFRMLMEFLVLRDLIQNATEKDIADLEEINTRLSAVRAMKPIPTEEADALELRFHERMTEAVHNRLLQEMYRTSFGLFNPTIFSLYNSYSDSGIDEALWPDSHIHYIRAIRKRDIFLAYQVATNLTTLEQWGPVMGEEEYSPRTQKPNRTEETV